MILRPDIFRNTIFRTDLEVPTSNPAAGRVLLYLQGLLDNMADGHSLFQWAPVMASQPTLTESASATIASPQVIDPWRSLVWYPDDAAKLGARWASWGGAGGNAYMSSGGVTGGSIIGAFEFDTDAAEIDLSFTPTSAGRPFYMYVDGQLAVPLLGKTTTGTAFAQRWMHINFGSSATRRILIPDGGLAFYQMNFPAAATVNPAPTRPRCLVAGDSFTEGTGATTANLGYATLLAHKFGWDLWASGLGGTGYVATNSGTRQNLPTRLAADVIAYEPDILIYAMGINDAAGPDVATNAAYCYDTVAAALPNCKQIVIGPWRPAAPYSGSAGTIANRDALKALCEARGIPFIDVGETDDTAWIVTGNKQTYHPTAAITGSLTRTGDVVTGITHTTGGVYASPPAATASGGGGTGCALSVTSNGRLVSATVINGGRNYTTASVTVGGDGTGATFDATITDGVITGLTLTNKGSGYTYPPPVTITGDGSGAIALSGWGYEITAIAITNGGTGYTSNPTLAITPAPSDGTHPPTGGHIYYAERLAYALANLSNPT